MKIRTETNIDQIKIEDIISLYMENEWGDKYNPELILNCFNNSSFVVMAIEQDSDKIIGFARVLSDGFLTTWICEILVSPSYQQKGVGSMLISKIKEDFNHTSIYAETFRGKEAFFEKNGIKARENMVVVSRRKHP